jgi:hypothetical protein
MKEHAMLKRLAFSAAVLGLCRTIDNATDSVDATAGTILTTNAASRLMMPPSNV